MSAVIIIRGFISNEQIGCTCNASLYSGWIDGTDKKKGRSARTIKRQSGDQDPSGAD